MVTVAGTESSTVSLETLTVAPVAVSFTTNQTLERQAAGAGAGGDTGDGEGDAELAVAGAGDAGDTDDDQDDDDDEAGEGAGAKPKPQANKPSADDEALLEAARLEGEQRAETRLQAQQREQREADEAEAAATSVKEAVTKARGRVSAHLDQVGVSIPDAEGKDVVYGLSPAAKSALLKEWDEAHGDVHKSFAPVYQGAITTAVLKLVAPDKRDATLKALDRAKDPDELIGLIADAVAPAARSLKDQGLDDLVKLSPKASRELLQRIRDEKKAARDKVMDDHGIDRAGEPDIAGAGAAPARLSWAQLRTGYGAGELTAAQEAEYFKQRAAREAAGE